MKVLMVNSFNYLRGGAERCFLDLSALLASHGHEVVPFCMQHERNRPSPYEPYFVSYIDFPTQMRESGLRGKLTVAERVLYSREAKQKIAQLIAETKPDIAHLHGYAHEISPSILPAIKEAGIPVVQTLHDYKLACPNTSFVSQGKVCERCKGHRYYNAVLHRCKRDSLPASLLSSVELYLHKLAGIHEKNIDLFISPSRFLQQKMQEHGIKVPIVNIPNFINPENFHPCYEPQDYFVYYGRLVAVKGVKTLFEAMKQINTSHLYVAGSGEMQDELETYTAENGITNITFLGHLNIEQLVPLVQRAAFTVVPSEWYENYSMTVIESLACGTPVIGARIGGIPEQVKEGHNGLLFAPGNAGQLAQKIQYLLANPQLAIEMGRNGRRQIETINSPQHHYQQTIEIYRHLLSGTELSSEQLTTYNVTSKKKEVVQ